MSSTGVPLINSRQRLNKIMGGPASFVFPVPVLLNVNAKRTVLGSKNFVPSLNVKRMSLTLSGA
jgi:hypothetical protein